MQSIVKHLGRSNLKPEKTALFICDLQEVFRNRIINMPTVCQSTNTIFQVSQLLQMPTIVTTQYAAKFGATLPEVGLPLSSPDSSMIMFEDKTYFSMLTENVERQLLQSGWNSVILCGIEAHVCILQTCLDLLERGVDVHVVVDAVSSQYPLDRSVALERMAQAGAYMTTMESIVFQLAKDSKHAHFKSISGLVKDHHRHMKTTGMVKF